MQLIPLTQYYVYILIGKLKGWRRIIGLLRLYYMDR